MACKINLDLGNGVLMPVLGYGTWQAPPEELAPALNEALSAGYRHIDTAYAYQNEDCIGDVLSEWISSGKLKREDLFIVTKLPCCGNRPSTVEKYLRRSLKSLKLDYVDLYLIHTPFTFEEVGDDPHPADENGFMRLEKSTDLVAIWKEMERMKDLGLTKAIGISNFNQKQIQKLFDNCRIRPQVLQIELHAYFQQKKMAEFCKANGIKITCYSPLGSKGLNKFFKQMGIDRQVPDLFANPVVVGIAKKLGVTSSQVLLRFLVQKGYSAIPKSTNATRLRQNLDVFGFELSESDMAEMEKLDQGPEARLCDLMFFKGIKEHPEYPF